MDVFARHRPLGMAH
jgi:hypothetical protein